MPLRSAPTNDPQARDFGPYRRRPSTGRIQVSLTTSQESRPCNADSDDAGNHNCEHHFRREKARTTRMYRSGKDIAMTLPVTVDPRYHEAVIFNLDAVLTDTDGDPVFESTIKLVRKLLDVGVATAVYSLRPDGQQLLKAAGVDDFFGVCVDGVPPRPSQKPPADSVCVRNGPSSSTTPAPGSRRPTTAVSHSSSVSTAPGMPTDYWGAAPTSWLRTRRMSLSARVTGGYRSSPMR